MSTQFIDKIDSNIIDNECLNLKEFINKPSSSLVPDDKTDIQAVKLFAFSVCHDYLGGVWKHVDIEHFKIERET